MNALVGERVKVIKLFLRSSSFEKIAILHPGSMGVSVAASAINGGNEVYWASEGRSAETCATNQFRGLYLDANAISPQRAIRIGEMLNAAGIDFVDWGNHWWSSVARGGYAAVVIGRTRGGDCRMFRSGSVRGARDGSRKMKHLQHIYKARKAGMLVLNGPFLHGGNLRGLSIWNATHEQVALHLQLAPLVQAGFLRFETYPWFGMPGDTLP